VLVRQDLTFNGRMDDQVVAAKIASANAVLVVCMDRASVAHQRVRLNGSHHASAPVCHLLSDDNTIKRMESKSAVLLR